MNEINKLQQNFERFVCGQSLHAAFTELLDWALLPFKKFDTAAEQTNAFEIFRNHSKVNQLKELVTMIGDLSEGFSDPLGELYMHTISNGYNGQFFTPEPICDMMASMSIGTNSFPGQTVYDCACGSGRMLLAAAKINRHLLLYGADIDLTCVKMTLLNMLLNSLQGEVAHMDSLANRFYTGYEVCTTVVSGHHIPYYIEFTDPQLSNMWLREKVEAKIPPSFDKPFEPVTFNHQGEGIQGTLF